MAATAHQGLGRSDRKNRSAVTFETARPEDDPDIRELLRQPLGGRVRLSLEREPDARLAAGVEGHRHYTLVTRDPVTGRVVGLGSRAVRRVWINGEPRWLGYLGQLRRDPGLVGKVRLLATGFSAMDRTHLSDELPYDLTSIVSDNHSARRLLERGLPGLPCYRPVDELTTVLLNVGSGWRGSAPAKVLRGSQRLLPPIVDCLQRNQRRYQFAPVWCDKDLKSGIRTRGQVPEDFLAVEERDRVVACLAIWDQRAFKQVIVRGYAPGLLRWRLMINVGLTLAGRPRLPRPGRKLNFAYLSHMAVDGDRPELLLVLIRGALAAARRIGLDHLVIGLATRNPMLPSVLCHFSGRSYRSILYVVHRREAETEVRILDGRISHVEVATI